MYSLHTDTHIMRKKNKIRAKKKAPLKIKR